jgi:pimeloyl-ACP methyl ester carboxylesterase
MDPARRTISVEGHELAYRRGGRGEPLLVVHGITTWSFIWDGLFEALTARHDVVAADLLGCGGSDMPLDASYSLADQARRMAALADELGLGRFHFAGHDLGGGIGQILAVRYPGRVRTLTLVNPVAYDLWPVQPILALRTPVVRQFLMATLDAGTLRLIVRRALHHKDLLTPELLERFREPLSTERGRKAFLHFARCLDSSDLTGIADGLRRLDLPVTVVWGMKDVYLPFAIADRLASEIPGCRLVRLETAGHFSLLDEPARVAEAILETTLGRRA